MKLPRICTAPSHVSARPTVEKNTCRYVCLLELAPGGLHHPYTRLTPNLSIKDAVSMRGETASSSFVALQGRFYFYTLTVRLTWLGGGKLPGEHIARISTCVGFLCIPTRARGGSHASRFDYVFSRRNCQLRSIMNVKRVWSARAVSRVGNVFRTAE